MPNLGRFTANESLSLRASYIDITLVQKGNIEINPLHLL